MPRQAEGAALDPSWLLTLRLARRGFFFGSSRGTAGILRLAIESSGNGTIGWGTE
jgi:hypothetical protein